MSSSKINFKKSARTFLSQVIGPCKPIFRAHILEPVYGFDSKMECQICEMRPFILGVARPCSEIRLRAQFNNLICDHNIKLKLFDKSSFMEL